MGKDHLRQGGRLCKDRVSSDRRCGKNVAKKEITKVVTVNTTTLRVREKASEDSAILSLVGEGEDLVVEDTKDGWYKVEVDDQKGYISGDYVEVTEKLPTASTVKELEYGEGYTDSRVSLVQFALQFVGNRYVWGGTSLTNGIDCSGFTMQVYARYGVGLPHHAASQPAYGNRIRASEAKPGDLFSMEAEAASAMWEFISETVRLCMPAMHVPELKFPVPITGHQSVSYRI